MPGVCTENFIRAMLARQTWVFPMDYLVVSALEIADNSVEIVERKGLGHPDTICDALAETLSRNLVANIEIGLEAYSIIMSTKRFSAAGAPRRPSAAALC